jgi:hypothetical protein
MVDDRRIDDVGLGAWLNWSLAVCGFSLGGTVVAALNGAGRTTAPHLAAVFLGAMMSARLLYELLRSRRPDNPASLLGSLQWWRDEVLVPVRTNPGRTMSTVVVWWLGGVALEASLRLIW